MRSIILEYIKFIQNSLFEYYRLLLGADYDKKLIAPFIQKYIDVRYYSNSIYEKESDFINKINKELILVAESLFSKYPEKEDKIKDFFVLFGYILYFDNCIPYSNANKLINSLYDNCLININLDIEKKREFIKLINNFIINKNTFWKLFQCNEFELKYKRLKKDLFLVDIIQKIKFSSIYSEYAINKSFNSEVVAENKFYLLLCLLNGRLLEDINSFEYNKYFVVDYQVSLISKSKKSCKFFDLLDNDISKDKISLRFTYKDYLDNKEYINNMVKDGYSISLILDDYFTGDYASLVLFNYIFVYEKYDYYDDIDLIKNSLNCTIITM